MPSVCQEQRSYSPIRPAPAAKTASRTASSASRRHEHDELAAAGRLPAQRNPVSPQACGSDRGAGYGGATGSSEARRAGGMRKLGLLSRWQDGRVRGARIVRSRRRRRRASASTDDHRQRDHPRHGRQRRDRRSASNDIILGGAGNDTIAAAGNDIIDGGAGNDVIAGRRSEGAEFRLDPGRRWTTPAATTRPGRRRQRLGRAAWRTTSSRATAATSTLFGAQAATSSTAAPGNAAVTGDLRPTWTSAAGRASTRRRARTPARAAPARIPGARRALGRDRDECAPGGGDPGRSRPLELVATGSSAAALPSTRRATASTTTSLSICALCSLPE